MGTFAQHPEEERPTPVWTGNCPGCPTLAGPAELLHRSGSLTEFKVGAVHFASCMKALCPFVKMDNKARAENFPGLTIGVGTHEEHVPPEEFRQRVARLFCQERKTMVDILLDRNT